MQIVHPNMLPMIAGFAMIFLFIVGIISVVLLIKGIKLLKADKSSFEARVFFNNLINRDYYRFIQHRRIQFDFL
jgi:hypothetical protein